MVEIMRFGYASQVAFRNIGEVTPTGESLSQMQKEIGKCFSDISFERADMGER
jgi:hypothetical protein